MNSFIESLESRAHLSGTKAAPPTLAQTYTGTASSLLFTSEAFTVRLVSQIKTKVVMTITIPAQTVGDLTLPSFPLTVKGSLSAKGILTLAGKVSQNLGLAKPVASIFNFKGTVTSDGSTISGNAAASLKAPFFSITKLPETVALSSVVQQN